MAVKVSVSTLYDIKQTPFPKFTGADLYCLWLYVLGYYGALRYHCGSLTGKGCRTCIGRTSWHAVICCKQTISRIFIEIRPLTKHCVDLKVLTQRLLAFLLKQNALFWLPETSSPFSLEKITSFNTSSPLCVCLSGITFPGAGPCT